MLADLTDDQSALDAVFAPLMNLDVHDGLKRTEEEFAGDMAENILGQHGPDGGSYPPLARPRGPGHNPGDRTLIDTGELLQSLIEGPDHIAEVSETALRSGTRNWKAAIHQEGTGTIPARPMVGVNEDMADKAAMLVADDLTKQMGG